MKHILAATDGSMSANHAVAFAADLARAFGAELTIVTAAGDLPDGLRDYAKVEHTTMGEILVASSRAVLKMARHIADRRGLTNIHTQSTIGNPVQFILKVADDTNADAIVVGKRGHGPLASLLIGSVSQKLAALAQRAVIVVP